MKAEDHIRLVPLELGNEQKYEPTKKYYIKITEGTKAKTMGQNDAINGLIREMYRVGGSSKPEEGNPEKETLKRFRKWVKADIICIYEVDEVCIPNTKTFVKRQKSKSIGDYNLTDGKKAIEALIAYITQSGMINDSKIQGIINDMEYNRG